MTITVKDGVLSRYTCVPAAAAIPDGVTEIGARVFCGSRRLRRAVIPDGVTGIGSSAFQNCGALERIVFPAGLEQVGVGAFAGCTRLTHVEAPTLAAWLAVAPALNAV